MDNQTRGMLAALEAGVKELASCIGKNTSASVGKAMARAYSTHANNEESSQPAVLTLQKDALFNGLSGAELREKLIELGWTPPGAMQANRAETERLRGIIGQILGMAENMLNGRSLDEHTRAGLVRISDSCQPAFNRSQRPPGVVALVAGYVSVSKDQLHRWHERMREYMQRAGASTDDVLAEIFRAWETTPGSAPAHDAAGDSDVATPIAFRKDPAAGARWVDMVSEPYREGRKARLERTNNPYPPYTLQNILHCQGWLMEDLRQALIKADPDGYGKNQSPEAPTRALTRNQISDAIGTKHYGPGDLAAFRAIERAHGIMSDDVPNEQFMNGRSLAAAFSHAYPRMDIRAPAGTMVVFDGCGGRDNEQEAALKRLVRRSVYEVESIEVGQSCSYVKLVGVEGLFNTCLFSRAPVKHQSPEAPIQHVQPVEWTDQFGTTHAWSIKAAAKTLASLFERWPGGLDEIESAMRTSREHARLIERMRTTGLRLSDFNADNGGSDIPEVTIDYTNHRGERALRMIKPLGIRFAATGHHQEAQWLLDAHDIGKDARRTFALRDVHRWDVKPYQEAVRADDAIAHAYAGRDDAQAALVRADARVGEFEKLLERVVLQRFKDRFYLLVSDGADGSEHRISTDAVPGSREAGELARWFARKQVLQGGLSARHEAAAVELMTASATDEPDDGWVTWDGTPTHSNLKPKPDTHAMCEVSIRHRDGTEQHGVVNPDEVRWAWTRPYVSLADIVAYKVTMEMPF